MNRSIVQTPAAVARKLVLALAAALAIGAAIGATTSTGHAANRPAVDGAPAAAPQYVRHTRYCTKAGCFLFTCTYDDNTHQLIECWVRWDPPPSEPGPRPSLP